MKGSFLVPVLTPTLSFDAHRQVHWQMPLQSWLSKDETVDAFG